MVVCVAIVGVLLSAGLLTDFLHSFVYALTKAEGVSAVQVKKSLLSVKTAMAAAATVDMLVLVYSYVSAMLGAWTWSVDKLAETMPLSLAILCSCAFSGVLAVLILLPIYARLKVRLIDVQAD